MLLSVEVGRTGAASILGPKIGAYPDIISVGYQHLTLVHLILSHIASSTDSTRLLDYDKTRKCIHVHRISDMLLSATVSAAARHLRLNLLLASPRT
jgi:hypothetical protein